MNVLAAVLLALPVTPVRADDDAKKALEQLKGEWKIVSYRHSDGDLPIDKDKSRVVFTDAKMTITFPERELASPFTIDAKADPKTIDVTPTGEKFVAKGIWKLEKDKLTVCFAIAGGDRPKDFTPAKTNSVMVLERVKK